MHEHLTCFNYDRSDRPVIEILRYAKGSCGERILQHNEVVFLLTGKMRYIFQGYAPCEQQGGEIAFFPAGGSFSFEVLEEEIGVVFRLHKSVKLCEVFGIEKLYNINAQIPCHEVLLSTKQITLLEINSRIGHFLQGIIDCVEDGIKCRHYFDMKIREFFLMLRTYYPKDKIGEFLLPILSGDIAFSEYVRKNWDRYHTMRELAESIYQTPKQFSAKFKRVFKQTPYKWMKEQKAIAIHDEIVTGKKSFKQIASEYGFSTLPQFTIFCKTELRQIPRDIRKNAL